MEEFEEIDVSDYRNHKKLLENLSIGRYENEFNRDWKAYLTEVFKYDDAPPSQPKSFRYIPKEKPHPFENWM